MNHTLDWHKVTFLNKKNYINDKLDPLLAAKAENDLYLEMINYAERNSLDSFDEAELRKLFVTEFYIWVNDYDINGDNSPIYLGKQTARTFEDACGKLLQNSPHYKRELMTYGGDKLFSGPVPSSRYPTY